MNLKQLIKFGMEESSVPVIKNPILRAALEPRSTVPGPRTGFKEGNGVYDEKELLGKRVRELMDEGYDFGEAVRQAMKEGYAEGGRIGYEDGQFVEPRQGFYKKGFVKPGRLTKEEIDQRYKEKKLKENPNYKAEIDRRWKAKKLKENPDWTPYKAGTHYKRRLEAKEKGLVYDMKTGKFRKAIPLTKYTKFVEAGDKKIIREWTKSLTDAAKAGDMSETLGFKPYLTKKYGDKGAQTIRSRVRLQLNFAPGEVSDTIQENFIDSLVKKHNESDKVLYSKKDIFDKVVLDRNLGRGREIYFNLDNQLENLDTKINKAFNKIVDGNLPIKASKKVTPHISKYSPITQMIAEISGTGSVRSINNALAKNPKFKNKEFVETFKYLNRAHAKDFIGMPFDEAFEYAKYRQGGLDVKGLVSYTTRYQNPESNIMSFAVRHANRHFRDDTKSQIQFYKLRADGTKGALLNFKDLPKNRDGDRVLDLKKVGFEYENQFFHKNNLKTKGFKSGLFNEVYAMSGKNRMPVPDPDNPSQKINLKKLLQMTGDKLTIGHDEALGGVKGAPFKGLRIQGEKLNTALFNAYDKIQNKDLRRLVLNQLEGQFKGLSGGDYEKAFVGGKVDEAKKAITSTNTLYRGAGKEVIKEAGADLLQWSSKKQQEILRVAGIDDKGFEKLKRQILKKMGNKVTNKEAGFLATAMIEDFGKLGIKGGKLLRWLQPELEPLFEGLFYQYAKQYKGYDHSLAREELFLPKILAKIAPNFYKKFIGPEFKTGILEGADPLIEKELYTHTDPREFVYFDGKEFKNPNFGKPTGKVDSKTLQYINALKDQERVYDVFDKKAGARDDFDLAEASADVRDLAKTGTISNINRILKPGSMASQAYNTAVEKHRALEDRRKEAALKKYDPRALERKQKSFDIYLKDKEGRFLLNDKGEKIENPRSLYKKRYQEMEEYKGGREGIFGGMSRKKYEKYQEMYPELKNIPYEDVPKFGDYKDFLKLKPEGFNKTYKELFPTPASRYDWDLTGEVARAGGYANMADGGLTRTVARDSEGIMSLKK